MPTERLIEASAPGKLILIGEYAVLEGAPALVVAIGRRASVRVRHGVAHNRLRAPQVCARELSFRIAAAGRVDWGAVDDTTRERLALLAHLLEHCAPAGRLAIDTDSSAFFDADLKLGFGSSAAITVAGAAALAGESPALDALVQLHRAVQGGRGSGCDVAASYLGGVLQYRALPRPRADALQLPAGLLLRCIWTGQAASTTAFLRGLDALGTRRKALDALVDAAGLAVAGLGRDAASWVAALAAYARALSDFAADTGLPVYAGGHVEVAGLAARHGVAYKPSGAGGGDIGVALSDDADAMRRFVTDLDSVAACEVAAPLDPRGLSVSMA